MMEKTDQQRFKELSASLNKNNAIKRIIFLEDWITKLQNAPYHLDDARRLAKIVSDSTIITPEMLKQRMDI